MSQFFSKLCCHFSGNSRVKFDLSHYATKSDLKEVIGVDASSIALKVHLASWKSDVDKLDNTDKL